MRYDAVIRNGMIVDGTGSPAYRADLAIKDGRVAAIGRPASRGELEIDATGCVASPGFIDSHNHADHGILGNPGAHNFVSQGVTTSVSGNCGLSVAPIVPEHRDEIARYLAPFVGAVPEYDWAWGDMGSFFERAEKLPLGQNVAIMTGHGSIRIAAMGFAARPPSPAEAKRMEELLHREFDCGAAGLSFGLYYPPGNFSERRELLPLMKIAAARGRRCAFHLRSETAAFLEAVDEALSLAEESGASVELSHHKVIGRPNWGKISESLRTMERARRKGIDVVCDAYPYTAGSTTIVSLLPPWVAAGGVEALLARLRDDKQRAAIQDEVLEDRMKVDNLLLLMEWKDIRIGDCPNDRSCEGKSLAEVLKRAVPSPESMNALMDWLVSIKAAALMVCLNLQNEDDTASVLAHPFSAIVSDAWIVGWNQGSPHPRAYGAIPRFLGRYVRERKLLRLEEGVRKITAAPAARFGLTGRGILAEGMLADVAVWDPEAILDNSTFEHPHRYATGIRWVFVNGRAALSDGVLTGAGAGRILRAGDAN